MNYNFTEKQKNDIISRGGDDFYLRILRDIETYSKRWKLYDINFLDYYYWYSVNAIFFCKSELYGDCVLKIGGMQQDIEFVSEYNALREYNGRRFVKIFEGDVDIENQRKVMLIERVIPGTRLSEEPSHEKRLAVFSELFNGLHIEPKNPEIYNTYIKWVCDTTDYIKENINCSELHEHAVRAKELCFEISKTYNKKVLLHGDFHFFNILLDENGNYKIIDPKGFIGDPVFDIMRYISNDGGKNGEAIKYFEKILGIPNKIIRQCWYIEMAMVNGWDIEDDGTVNLDGLRFAEDFMNKGEKII